MMKRGWWVVLALSLSGCALVDALGGSDEAADGSVGGPDAAIADGPVGTVDGSIADASPPDAAPPAVGPSCTGLSTTCGSGGNDSCCASSKVPGAMYYRSYDEATDDYDDMSYPATVSDFWLDRYEITVGRFRKFVEDGNGTQAQPPVGASGAHSAIAGSGWQADWNSNLAATKADLKAAVKCDVTYQTWTDTPGANEHRPMNCITWYEAMAFCIWDGGYLPTEAEWNYAATGGAEQRAYPWSSPASSTTIDSSYAVYDNNEPLSANVGSKSPKGNGRWGHADLAGNVWEWMLDWLADPYSSQCNDCANLTAASYRVNRGGSFDYNASALRTAYRVGSIPTFRDGRIGARCARTP